LGYPGDQAISLFCASLVTGWLAVQARSRWKPVLGIAVCLLSVFVAQSRGGILFSFLLLLLAGSTYWLKMRSEPVAAAVRRGPSRQALLTGLVVVLGVIALGSVAVQSVRNDSRWKTMADKVTLGLQYENPAQLLCDGPSAAYEASIRQKFADNPQYAEDVIYGLKVQDGGRILLMRVASQMVLENGRGLDGSRDSFKKLIAEKCGHVPVLDFAHSHQGWLDLALALGWAGLVLFATVLFFFLRKGWQSLSQAGVRHWAFALFLVSAFWIARGFADSIYREHNLEMQFLVISYLYARMVFCPDSRLRTA
jgi:O-antigen ligase